MKRKIIGVIIIFSGLIIMVGMVYFMFFMKDYPLSKIMSLFRSEEIVEIEEPNNKKPELPEANIPEDNSSDVPVTSININQGNTNIIKPIITEPEPVENKIEEKKVNAIIVNKESIARMASSFVERFGSFSNQSDFKNISDLKPYMTKKMNQWADDYVADNRAGGIPEIYYGITTKSVNYEYVSYDDDLGTAEIIVRVRRRESVGLSANTTTVFNQDIKISLKKENSAWKIDSAYWQEKK